MCTSVRSEMVPISSSAAACFNWQLLIQSRSRHGCQGLHSPHPYSFHGNSEFGFPAGRWQRCTLNQRWKGGRWRQRADQCLALMPHEERGEGSVSCLACSPWLHLFSSGCRTSFHLHYKAGWVRLPELLSACQSSCCSIYMLIFTRFDKATFAFLAISQKTKRERWDLSNPVFQWETVDLSVQLFWLMKDVCWHIISCDSVKPWDRLWWP